MMMKVSPVRVVGTMSTAAHHASVVTIVAGLGGGRAARTCELSLSSAEYDPFNLRTMMSGVNSKHSLLGVNPSKSKHQVHHFSANFSTHFNLF